MEDCHNQSKWTKSESDSDSKIAEAAEGPSAEVHRRSLAPESVGSSKKKPKLSLTILMKTAAICPYPIMAILCSLGSSPLQHIRLVANSVESLPRTRVQ